MVRDAIEPPAFRFSAESAASLHVVGRGLTGDLPAETMTLVASYSPASADVGSPFGSPFSLAPLTFAVLAADHSQHGRSRPKTVGSAFPGFVSGLAHAI